MTRVELGGGEQSLALDVIESGPDGGPAVVLIAGGFMDMDQWQPVADVLAADGRRVIRYDQRGIGASDAPTTGYTIEQLAADALALIDALEAAPAVLVGNSLGGSVALCAALAAARSAPDQVRALALSATSAGPQGEATPPETMSAMMRGAGLPVEQAAAALMDVLFATDYVDEHPEVLDRAIAKRTAHAAPMIATLGPLQSLLAWDPLPRLSELSLPTLVLHGADDALAPVSNGELLSGRIAGAQLRVLEDAGHAVVMERWESVSGALSSFLEGVSG